MRLARVKPGACYGKGEAILQGRNLPRETIHQSGVNGET